MNETIEEAAFLKEPILLATSSQRYIERLWKIGVDVSKFAASVSSLFSSIFNTLAEAVVQVVSFSKGVCKLSLTRLIFLPSLGFLLRRVTPPREEYFPTEIGRADVSFLFNVTVARKTAAELVKRIAAKTPPALFPTLAPLPKAQLAEETLQRREEEPAKTVSDIVADLQGRFEHKLSPSIKGVTSVLEEYGKRTILPTPLLMATKPHFAGPERLETPPPPPFLAPPKEEPLRVVVPEEETPPLYAELRPEAARAFGYATELPSVFWERSALTLETAAALSTVVSPSLAQMPPSRMGPLLEEIYSLSTSSIYDFSRVSAGIALSLSMVPFAAAIAQKVVQEALIQPIPSPRLPWALVTREPLVPRLVPFRPETDVRLREVEAFRLPAIVSSIVAAIIRRHPLLFGEPALSETLGTPFELMQAVPEEITPVGKRPEVTRFAGLTTAVAQAVAESLVVQKLQGELSVLMKEIQVAPSSYAERLAELSASAPIRLVTPGKLIPAAPALPHLEPYVQIPSTPPPRPKLEPISPTFESTINITTSPETTDEDLRDLERKIDRILSEQIRRYYGSPRI